MTRILSLKKYCGKFLSRYAVFLPLLLLIPTEACAARYALLISINSYANGHYSDGSSIAIGNLEAPNSDTRRLAELLPSWGYTAQNIKLLQNEQATRSGVLKELAELYSRSATGDDVLIYYSGHGTSWLNSSSAGEQAKNYSSALIPWDYALLREKAGTSGQALLDARRDLRPLFQKYDEGGRNVLLVMDSCYSGALRSGEAAGTLRFVPVENFVMTDDMDQAPEIEPLINLGSYHRLALLSAAAIGQRAAELSRPEELKRWPTEDGKAHGVFTDALLRVLSGKLGADFNHDQRVTPRELHEAISIQMASQGFAQTPMLVPGPDEDDSSLNRPLFGKGYGDKPALPAYGMTRPLKVRLEQAIPHLERSLSTLAGVVLLSAKDNTENMADITILEIEGGVKLVDANGSEVETLPEDAKGVKTLARINQLVISNRLHQLAMKHSRGLLPFMIKPQQFGEFVPEGERLGFVVRPDSNVTLLIFALSSQGQISLLYPLDRHERTVLPAKRSWSLARLGIDPVLSPCGSGEQLIFAFAFDKPPEELDRLASLQGADIQTALPIIEQMLVAHSGAFLRAEKHVRTVISGAGVAAKRTCAKT